MLINEAIAQGSIDLKFAGIGTPSLDATLLLSHVLKTCRSSLISKGTEQLSQEACSAFCKLIERRAAGVCVAYIIGKKEFRGLEFTVNPSVLVPRPDTEALVEAALELIKKNLPRTITNSHLRYAHESTRTKERGQNTLFDWYKEQSKSVENLFLMHRLDYETHGLVLFAKNETSFNFFKELQDKGEFIKEYSAICSHSINEPQTTTCYRKLFPSIRSRKKTCPACN
jgi:hypothetical protein